MLINSLHGVILITCYVREQFCVKSRHVL